MEKLNTTTENILIERFSKGILVYKKVFRKEEVEKCVHLKRCLI